MSTKNERDDEDDLRHHPASMRLKAYNKLRVKAHSVGNRYKQNRLANRHASIRPHALLLTSVISVVRSSPIARDNDGSRPITWICAAGNQRCWQVDNGNIQANQIPVVADCDESDAQRFIYNTGATSIQVASANFCVEFGPGLGVNGRPLRIQNCRQNGAPGQRLFITDDSHIALQNGPGQCADVTDGGESAQLQSWGCAPDNINQIFFGEPSALSGDVTFSPFGDISLYLGILNGSCKAEPVLNGSCWDEPLEALTFYPEDTSETRWDLGAGMPLQTGNTPGGDVIVLPVRGPDPEDIQIMVLQYESLPFTGNGRLRCQDMDLCLEVRSRFEGDREIPQDLFLAACSDSRQQIWTARNLIL